MDNLLNSQTEQPLYKQLESKIRSEILGGSLSPGDKIETEEELSEKYGVSRITVRNAVSVLVEDGFLVKRQGKGTFVCKPKIERDIIAIEGFTLACEVNGTRAGSKTISIAEVDPTIMEMENLGLSENDKLIELRRIRYTGNEALSIEISAMVPKYKNLLSFTKMDTSLYKWIEENYGDIATTSKKTIEVTFATQEEAELLSIPFGSALFLIKGFVYDQDGKPMHKSVQLINADRYKFLIN